MDSARLPGLVIVGMGWAASTTAGYTYQAPAEVWSEAITRQVVAHFLELAYRRGDLSAAFERCVDERGFRGFQSGQSVDAKITRKLLLSQLAGANRVEILQLEVEADVAVARLEFFDNALRPIGNRTTSFRVRNGRIVEQWDTDRRTPLNSIA